MILHTSYIKMRKLSIIIQQQDIFLPYLFCQKYPGVSTLTDELLSA